MPEPHIWHDKKGKSIEDQLNTIMIGLIDTAAWTKESEAYFKRMYEKDKVAAEIRRKQEERRRIEELKIRDLEERTERWLKHKQMKEYVEAVRQTEIARNGKLDPESEVGKWLEWAEVRRVCQVFCVNLLSYFPYEA